MWRNDLSVSWHLQSCSTSTSTSTSLNWSRQREEGSLKRQQTGGGLCLARRNTEQVTMAENKIGPNLQAGAGFIAKRVQKSLNRAQEKVSQRSHSNWLSLSSELYKPLSAIRSVLEPLERDMSMLGCRFPPRYSWSKMWNDSRAAGHYIRCHAFPALPQSNRLKMWTSLLQVLVICTSAASQTCWTLCWLCADTKAATSWLHTSSLLSVSHRGSFFCSFRGLSVAWGCFVMAVWSFWHKDYVG